MNSEQPSGDIEGSIGRYLDGDLDADGIGELKAALREDEMVRDRYLEAVRMDAMLREIAGRKEAFVSQTEKPAGRRSYWPKLAAMAACLVGILGIVFAFGRGDSAEIRELSRAEWVSESWETGDSLKPGDLLELAAGSVEISFRSGASTRLVGPARFEIVSENSGFLHYGEAESRADSPSSHGFTIQTRSGNFIDQGTEFLTTAGSDGFSQMHVTSGAVDVEVSGLARQRLEKGSGLGIEPGERPVLIRIEAGEETPAFQFPSIAPPSDEDWADRRQGHDAVELISVDQKGRTNLVHRSSGPPIVLFDGKGQNGPNLPGESFFFSNSTTGMILLDLGELVFISKIHTYSWHLKGSEERRDKALRAVQRYTLWGATGDRPGQPPSEDDPGSWTRIARVDTDAFFGVTDSIERPAQQACAITSTTPSLGLYRYLIFELKPTWLPGEGQERHTFLGEIDVFAHEKN